MLNLRTQSRKPKEVLGKQSVLSNISELKGHVERTEKADYEYFKKFNPEKKQMILQALKDLEEFILTAKTEEEQSGTKEEILERKEELSERFDLLKLRYPDLDLDALYKYVLSNSRQFRQRVSDLVYDKRESSFGPFKPDVNKTEKEELLLKLEKRLYFDERNYALAFLRNGLSRLLIRAKKLYFENEKQFKRVLSRAKEYLPVDQRKKIMQLFDKIDMFLYENELYEAKYSTPDRGRQLRNLDFAIRKIITTKNDVMKDKLLKFLEDVQILLKEFNLEPNEFKVPRKPLIKLSDIDLTILMRTINDKRSLNVLSEIVSRDFSRLGYNPLKINLDNAIFDAVKNYSKEYFKLTEKQRSKTTEYKFFIRLVFRYLKDYKRLETLGKSRVESGAIRLDKGYEEYIADPNGPENPYKQRDPWEHVSVKSKDVIEEDKLREYVKRVIQKKELFDFDYIFDLDLDDIIKAQQFFYYISYAPKEQIKKSLNAPSKKYSNQIYISRLLNILRLFNKFKLSPKQLDELRVKLDLLSTDLNNEILWLETVIKGE